MQMATNNNGTSLRNRPYRSHKVPACTRCRSRKIRCHIDIPGEPCLSCRERRLKCQYVETSSKTSPGEDGGENGDARPTKRARLSNADPDPDKEILDRARAVPAVLHKTSHNPSASILLAPHVAEDVDILQRHIDKHKTSEGEAPQAYQTQTLSHDTRNPIVYLSVPRFRTGMYPQIGAGKEQLEIVEQIMGPFKQELIDLYFNYTHPFFPILDDETCALIRSGKRDKVPNPLMACVYAMGSPNWRKSDTLKLHPRPESHYVWNKAITAVLEDFLSPSMATICAAVLDQVGRPSVSIMNNSTLCARTVSLAQMFGLHRNPSKWDISDNEKSTRVRAWWGVLITDYWTSIAYGAPPHIVKGFYDVPLPTLESLISPKATLAQKCASTCFVHFCSITELLGEILPLVHTIETPDPADLDAKVSEKKAILNDLEAKLPEWLPLPNRSGTSNLWFCFLCMRLLLARVALRAAVLLSSKNPSHPSHPSLEKTRHDELASAAAAVLDFMLILGENQFQDFWLPYATHMLVMAVMVSLRCAVEESDLVERRRCVGRLEKVMRHIEGAWVEFEWDIAGYCIERCAGAVGKMARLVARDSSAGGGVGGLHGSDSVDVDAGEGRRRSVALTDDSHTHLNNHNGNGTGNGNPISPSPLLAPTTTSALDDNPTENATATATAPHSFEADTDPLPDGFGLNDILDLSAFDFSWEALWDTPNAGMTNFGL